MSRPGSGVEWIRKGFRVLGCFLYGRFVLKVFGPGSLELLTKKKIYTCLVSVLYIVSRILDYLLTFLCCYFFVN